MRELFSTQGFMPHGHCYLWRPEIVWLHVVSDSLIFLAYVIIPITLVYIVLRRKDLPFDWMFLCFGVFIVSCGLTHAMEVWTLWHPNYWLSGAIKVVTALASLCTAALLMRLVPVVLALPSPSDLRRVAAALEVSERRFRAAAEGSGDAFYILEGVRDAAGAVCDFKYLYANAHTRERLPTAGPVPNDLEGTLVSDHYPVSLLRQLVTRCAGVMRDGTPLDEELEMVQPDQEHVWRQLQIVPLGAGVAVTSRDITQRKRDEAALRRAEERFRGLLESAPDAMVIADSSGHIVFTNQQTGRLFGYTPEELSGQVVEVLLPESVRHGHVQKRGDYARAPKARSMGLGLDLLARRKDGSEFPVEISLSPLETESGPLVSSTIRDVSERRKMESALKIANQELESFSYSVAHDLRAPLRGIAGFAQILLADHAAKLDAEGKDCLQEIRVNSDQMSNLIDALLSLSRVTRSQLRLEPVDVTGLAKSVANDIARSDPARQVEIVIEPGLSANMDLVLARTLITNLIANAWKFTTRVPQPRIEIGTTGSDGARAIFVRDNGAGFNKDFASKLFAPFQRLHTAREFPGTGIGLATVQRIVHRHGGRVWAEGSVNAGATFYFRIPPASLGASA
jgi:PAS domain S-box-containing protein